MGNEEVVVEITTTCNYRCVFCPRERFTRPIEAMSMDLFRSIMTKLKQYPQYGICTFGGFGEPLTDPHFFEKVDYALESGFELPLITTNGSLLDEKEIDRLNNSAITAFKIAIFAHSRETYKKVHGVDNFEHVKRIVTYWCKMKKRPLINVHFLNIKGVNDFEKDAWIEYWKDKADVTEVWAPSNWVNARNYRKVQREKTNTCGKFTKSHINILVDGTVNPCCYDFNAEMRLGDFKTQSLEKIFSSPFALKLAEAHRTGKFEGFMCENCDQRNKNRDNVLLYSSRDKIEDRINRFSSSFKEIKRD